jgi:hypothetical protein
MVPQKHSDSVAPSATLTIPELKQSEAAVLNTLASVHSRRCYAYAIERFIARYCSEPRLTFNRTVVVRYASYLESLHLSAATINLHFSAIRRLADESAESGWLSPELAIGIRRVLREAARTEEWQLAHAQSGVTVGERRLKYGLARMEGWSNPRVTSGVWIAPFGSRGIDAGPTANEGWALGHR